MMIAAVSTAVFGLLLLGPAKADKDDSYYIAGTGNPNKDEKMYWKDAENVFQDLSQFSTLYVEFQNCAWTWMQTSDEDNDIDENDYWYMGKIPPSGANVAYSLYGSLKGETFGGCGEDTFINSFYTNSGFTNFAKAMNYAGVSGFSSYAYDDDSYSSYTASCNGGYGIGCDYSNGFAVHTYSGDECNPADYSGVKDKLSSLNSAMASASCVKIYDSSTYNGSPYGTPLELLAYSHSCFYQDFFSPDGVCPDPYGKLAYYQQQFYNGIQESRKQDPYNVAQRKKQYNEDIKRGKVCTVTGLGLAALAFIILFFECMVSLFGYKERDMRKYVPRYVPRQDDFIVKQRGQDDVEASTIGDRSATSYVTSSNETNYTPPIDVAPPVVLGSDVAPPPQVVLPPPVAAPPQVHIAAPTAAPSVISPPQAPTPPVVIAPTPIAPPEAVTPAPVVPTSQPGNEMHMNVLEQDELVTLYAPPSVIPKTEALDREIVNDAKTQELPPVVVQPPPAPPVEETASTEKESPKSEEADPTPPTESQNNSPEPEEVASTPATESPTEEEGPESEDVTPAPPAESPVEPEELEPAPTVEAPSNAENSSSSLPEDDASPSSVEKPSSSLPKEAPTASTIEGTPTMKSINDAEDFTPLFSDIRGSSSEPSPFETDAAASIERVPSIDEIALSREEFESDSDEDVAKTQVKRSDSELSDKILASLEGLSLEERLFVMRAVGRSMSPTSESGQQAPTDSTAASLENLTLEERLLVMRAVGRSMSPTSESGQQVPTESTPAAPQQTESVTETAQEEGSSTNETVPEEQPTEQHSSQGWFGFGASE